jgi:chromosome segregation ATPase
MYIFDLIKSLPLVAILSLGGYGYHWFKIQAKDAEIQDLQAQLAQYQAEKSAWQLASQQQENTIARLQDNAEQQRQAIDRINGRNQELSNQVRDYMGVFRRHNLTRLAIAKPGLIENRINNGTQQIFQQLEQETTHDEPNTNSTPPAAPGE